MSLRIDRYVLTVLHYVCRESIPLSRTMKEREKERQGLGAKERNTVGDERREREACGRISSILRSDIVFIASLFATVRRCHSIHPLFVLFFTVSRFCNNWLTGVNFRANEIQSESSFSVCVREKERHEDACSLFHPIDSASNSAPSAQPALFTRAGNQSSLFVHTFRRNQRTRFRCLHVTQLAVVIRGQDWVYPLHFHCSEGSIGGDNVRWIRHPEVKFRVSVRTSATSFTFAHMRLGCVTAISAFVTP